MNFPKLIAALLLAQTIAGAAAAQEIRVTTFNIRYGTANDGPDAWPLRRAALFDWLRAGSADIISLQEALRPQIDDIRQAIPAFDEVGVGRDDGRTAGEYSAILYRRGRLRVLDSGTFWFSDTPAVPGSKSWGNNVTRICTWARFDDTRTRRTFYVFNLHLDHESQPSRERSVFLLKEAIENRRAGRSPVIVTGDFNAGEDNPAVRAMQAGFRDSWRVYAPAESIVGTFNAFRGDSTGPKIDYIFVGDGIEVLHASIDRPRTPSGRHLSDHFPVSAIVWIP